MMKYMMCALLCTSGLLTACSEKNELPPAGAAEGEWENFDATDHGKWYYINLKTQEVESHPVPGNWVNGDTGEVLSTHPDEEVTIDWQLAIHRYEMRTNGGAVAETGYTDIDAVMTLPADGYVQDEEIDYNDGLALLTDRSQMGNGIVGYAEKTTINRTLCGWTERIPQPGMPPVLYVPTQKVFVLRCQDGTHILLQFTDAGNTATGTSGYLTFNYEVIANE